LSLILKLCSAGGKNSFNKQISSQPAFIFDRPVTLNAPDGMLYPHPERRNHPVTLFLFRS
jgi:hypothetical protein